MDILRFAPKNLLQKETITQKYSYIHPKELLNLRLPQN